MLLLYAIFLSKHTHLFTAVVGVGGGGNTARATVAKAIRQSPPSQRLQAAGAPVCGL